MSLNWNLPSHIQILKDLSPQKLLMGKIIQFLFRQYPPHFTGLSGYLCQLIAENVCLSIVPPMVFASSFLLGGVSR